MRRSLHPTMRTRLPQLAGLALIFFFATHLVADDSPATTRAAFLKLIARPSVPLAPELSPGTEKDGLVQLGFSYAADADQRVPAILVKPAAESAARRPVMISLHGTGGSKEGQVALLRQFADAGFIAVAIDGRYHGARRGDPAVATAYTDAILRAYRAEEPHEHPFYYDTVRDVMRLIDYLITRDDVDPARIGVIGFSKGGTEAYLAAAADPRIAATVVCIGVQSFRWALENNSWQSRIGTIQAAVDAAARDARTTADAAFIRRFYARVVPGITDRFDGPAMLPLIAPRPLLAINGELDPRTPAPGLALCAAAARTAYAAAGAPENFVLRIQPATGHKVNPDSLVAARAWLAQHLKP
jgi:dienelactone hydrolase